MKKYTSIICVTLLCVIAACSKSTSSSEQDAKNVMIWNNLVEPEYLDPTLAADSGSSAIIDQLFEGLTDFHPETLAPIPGVAKSWKISDDGKVYTFSLRPEAKWSDGSALTAHDFVYSWQRAVNPITAAKYASQLYYIKNAQKINKGEIKDLSKLGVTAVDDYTLRVELENPTPFFLSITAWYTLRPVKQSVLEKHGRKWTRPEHLVGNGYFALKEWIPSKHIIIEPNEHYWDRKQVKLDQVKFLVVEDRETSLKMFQQGAIHYVKDVPVSKLPYLREKPELVDGPILGTYYLSINTDRIQNKLVRQALVHAIDRKQITKVLNKGVAYEGFVPKGMPGYKPAKGLEFNPAKAKQLLAQAGFADPQQLPKITLVYNTSENHKLVMQLVQNMWKQHLGIEVAIQNMEWKVLLKTWQARDYDISRNGWFGDYMDPNTFLDFYVTGNGNNHTAWGDKRYDQLISLAAQTTDQAKRFAYFQEAEAILLEAAPVIPLYTYTMPMMISTKLSGFYHNLQDIHPLKRVSLNESKVVKK